jgi:SAM-dependent methyltransferase
MPPSPVPNHPGSPPAGRRGVRKRLCACILKNCAAPHERLIASRKQALLAGLRGHIVEIGPGTGVNLQYLAPSASHLRYTALEPNAYLHAPLAEAARTAGITMDLHADPIGPGRAPLPDDCADAVICTLVLCSVPDPAAAVREVARLLRPGGRFIFLEHVAAPPRTLLRAVQRSVRPLWRIGGDGCEPDRDTEVTIRTAAPGALRDPSVERFVLPVPIIAPHIAGTAIRAEGA